MKFWMTQETEFDEDCSIVYKYTVKNAKGFLTSFCLCYFFLMSDQQMVDRFLIFCNCYIPQYVSLPLLLTV